MNIVIIDYGMGNLGSILNMIKKVGANAIISNNIEDIKKADKLILPGVGNFYKGMNQLKKLNLVDIIKDRVINNSIPILGICLGFQLLGNYSEEGNIDGLGIINSKILKFNEDKLKEKGFKNIHMGWNCIKINKKSKLFENIGEEPRFYFVHSYFMDNYNKEDILSITNYGGEFTSSIEKGNIYGVQFHPEKSHNFGKKVIYNFIFNI